MDDEDEQQRYEEALQREYVKLKVELAQVQSDTERHKLMSTQLSSETDQLRSAIAQSQNAEREMRDLAKQLADEVSKLQREVKSKEEERDQVKAEAERTQEQRAQLEKTLEVLGGRKVTELLNSRRRNSQGIDNEEGEAPEVSAVDVSSAAGSVLASRRSLLGRVASVCEQNRREDRDATVGTASADGAADETNTTRVACSTVSVRSIGHSARSLGVEAGRVISNDRPSLSGPNTFLFDKGQEDLEADGNQEEGSGGREQNRSSATASISGRTNASSESRPSVSSALSTDSLKMSVRDFMKGLDKEC